MAASKILKTTALRNNTAKEMQGSSIQLLLLDKTVLDTHKDCHS